MTDQNPTQPKKPTQPQDPARQNSGRREREDDMDPDRFDEERLNRDRSVIEQENQGHGPLNVGDQSRSRN